MKINALPIDLYRQAGTVSASGRDSAGISTATATGNNGVVRLPAGSVSAAEAVSVTRGPSPFAGVLSTEEKTLLVKYFACFGDDVPVAPAYGRESRGSRETFTGANLDVRV